VSTHSGSKASPRDSDWSCSIELAAQVQRFVDQLVPPQTEKEQLAAALLPTIRETRANNKPFTR
jgi:hypothetical protein